MKIKELKQKTIKEMHDLLKENREKLRVFRFDMKAGKVKNVKTISKLKKDIARILTILNSTR